MAFPTPEEGQKPVLTEKQAGWGAGHSFTYAHLHPTLTLRVTHPPDRGFPKTPVWPRPPPSPTAPALRSTATSLPSAALGANNAAVRGPPSASSSLGPPVTPEQCIEGLVPAACGGCGARGNRHVRLCVAPPTLPQTTSPAQSAFSDSSMSSLGPAVGRP